jgi:hypothetical protein
MGLQILVHRRLATSAKKRTPMRPWTQLKTDDIGFDGWSQHAMATDDPAQPLGDGHQEGASISYAVFATLLETPTHIRPWQRP